MLLNFPWLHSLEKEISYRLIPRNKEKSLTPARFEPMTSGSDHRCSNQLSYEAKLVAGLGNKDILSHSLTQ